MDFSPLGPIGQARLGARWYASLRGLRIADGPDEVHLMAIARRELRRRDAG